LLLPRWLRDLAQCTLPQLWPGIFGAGGKDEGWEEWDAEGREIMTDSAGVRERVAIWGWVGGMFVPMCREVVDGVGISPVLSEHMDTAQNERYHEFPSFKVEIAV